MKVCPVCNALAFDDAETCFGCMHRFGEDDGTEESQGKVASQDAPEFLIKFTPQTSMSGAVTWACAVETAP